MDESEVDAMVANNGYLTTFTEVDGSITNEIQQLSVSGLGDTLYLQNGGYVIIPGISLANGSIPDADGNVYTSVTIGTQEWMTENLRTTKYSDGTAIPNVTDNDEWSNLSTGAWSHYDNDSSQYDATYGKLYNWYATSDSRNLCPTGWHVSTDFDWGVLTDYLGANGHNGTEGTALKATSGWNEYNGQRINGTDDYGWNGLPGGRRKVDGSFYIRGYTGHWWSSSETYGSLAHPFNLNFNYGTVSKSGYYKEFGFSVRCLRD